ncbi:hypothetical protein H6784_04875 [Candidatus Nomurabacteria bacterium]|nr:hypothetical protein [Candidatus Kaiserbacteria bacterium]MCB9814723.1 hypothetical protein [Candidatus Nomurabacteria bacterium]
MKRYLQAFTLFVSGIVLMFLHFEVLLRFEFPDVPWRLFVYGALLEESLKFVFALITLRLGAIPLTIAFIGLGYGFGEQLTHFWFPNGTASLITPWMHAIAGVAMAVMFDRAVRLKSKRYYAFALIIPLLIHAFYNQFLAILLWWYTT